MNKIHEIALISLIVKFIFRDLFPLIYIIV